MATVVLAAGSVTVPPPDPDVPLPLRSYVLVGADGDRVDLSNWDEYLVDRASSFEGFGMPLYAAEEDETPGVDGATDGDLRVLPRQVGVTVRLGGRTHAHRAVLANRLARALHSKVGSPSLEVTTPGLSARMATGRYVGGAEAVQTAIEWGRFPIVLRCAREPYWTDTAFSAPPPITWTPPAARPWFPFPGWIRPGSGQVLGGPLVVPNDGDAEIYPDWLLAGPATGFTLSHLSRGRSMTWTGALAAGKWLLVITQPGSQEVVDSDGVNRYFELDQVVEPDFWTLAPGSNTIQATVTGVGAGTSFTLLNRRRRWLTAG